MGQSEMRFKNQGQKPLKSPEALSDRRDRQTPDFQPKGSFPKTIDLEEYRNTGRTRVGLLARARGLEPFWGLFAAILLRQDVRVDAQNGV
jgi:hypothetical protein